MSGRRQGTIPSLELIAALEARVRTLEMNVLYLLTKGDEWAEKEVVRVGIDWSTIVSKDETSGIPKR